MVELDFRGDCAKMEVVMGKCKVLVTGGTGYIGSHTVVEMLGAGYDVEIVDNLCNSKTLALGRIAELTGVGPKFYRADLRDRAKMREIFANGNYDAVIHFAGLKAVAESTEQPLRYYDNNVGGTLALLDCMKEFGVKKIVFSSSATVYGVQESPKYVETMQTGGELANPYGRTKWMIEEILKDTAGADDEFAVTLLRYFNPVGAHPSGLLGEDPNDRPNNLMPIMLKVATGEFDTLSVYGNDYPTPDGSCIRDYIHVVDLAKGHLAALDRMSAGVQVYNLGAGRGVSVLEMVRAFSEVSGMALPYQIAGRRSGDLAEFFADPTLAEQELGWKTALTIEDAMRDSLKYLEVQGLRLRQG